jgi:hypothetical protein
MLAVGGLVLVLRGPAVRTEGPIPPGAVINTEIRVPREKGWRPSRRQARVALVVGLLVVVILAGWARAVATPPKLQFSNIAVFPVDPEDAKAIHNRLGREVEIDFVPAGRFTVLLDLTNGGHRQVRIGALPDEWDLKEALFSSSALDGDRRRPEYVDESVQPFTLSPGESVTVRYAFKFPETNPHPGCMLSPDQTRSIPVTYQKLGFRRTRWMPLDEAYLSTFTGPRCDGNLKPAQPS